VKLQRPLPEIRIFFAALFAALDDQNASPALARLDGAHQTGGATTGNDYIIAHLFTSKRMIDDKLPCAIASTP
jgi:hypothetical protein